LDGTASWWAPSFILNENLLVRLERSGDQREMVDE